MCSLEMYAGSCVASYLGPRGLWESGEGVSISAFLPYVLQTGECSIANLISWTAIRRLCRPGGWAELCLVHGLAGKHR